MPDPGNPDALAALERRLARERRARRESENVAENVLRQWYETVNSLQRITSVLDETTDFVFISTLDGVGSYLNHAIREHLGLGAAISPETVNVLDLLTPASQIRFSEEALPTAKETGLWRGEAVMIHATTGSEIPVSQVVIAHRVESGDITSISCVSRDITERRALEAQLTHLAMHDPLTGLPNRRLLSDRLDVALARAARAQTPVGLFFIDLDGFKAINDEFGHEAGDHVLVAMAERLTQCVRPGDTVCRLGGDEFCVLCEHVTDDDGAHDVAARLLAQTDEPIEHEGNSLSVTMSIGAVVATRAPEGGPERLLQQADTAMYEAKRRGKAQAVFA